ncbi:hypothetical protein [Paeniglutamicibacter terrestris]|uniref:Uracil-DNA glycosylase n=1 Tax=Paeniglutamicibacter terrestris TaxID=2723403 RepID=A0ABX1G8H5_9MICC|nr:hypothetical protein [Paeniglutamicibacter terrestris]NKG22329.1 hypothetical protein [Paeniglutamicibacter terrestris]
MPRKMIDPDFRHSQESELWAEHVAPLNSLVEDLRAATPENSGSVPYFAPLNGGTDATILCLMPAPDAEQRPSEGEDLVSTEDDNVASEALTTLLEGSNIDAKEVLVAHAYPWYRSEEASGRLTGAEMTAGLEPMSKMLRLVPNLRAVILMGKGPEEFWAKITKKYPQAITRITAIPSFSPAPLSLSGTAAQREQRIARRSEAMREARSIVRAPRGPMGPRRESMVRAEDLGPEHLSRVIEVSDGNQTLHGPLLKAYQPSPEWRVTLTVDVAGARRALGVSPDTWVRVYRGAGIR